MPTTSLDTIRCSSLLAALAAPERLRIVRFLAAGPQNVSTIAKNLCIPNSNLSHHLATLTNANFLRREHRGRFVYYSLRPGVLRTVTDASGSISVLELDCCHLIFPTFTATV